jgi:hypothetical protein
MAFVQADLEVVLELQPSWSAKAPNQRMAQRGQYVKGALPSFVKARQGEIADRLHCSTKDVAIHGKDATGFYSRVPWIRIADRRRSPNPREGWYAVYLFAEDGSEVSLSLNQGTQVWDGVGMRSRPLASIRARSDWARAQLEMALAERSRLDTSIHLGSGEKGRAYEAGAAVAYRYPRGDVPDDEALASDLLDIVRLLRLVYDAEARGPVPGEPAPEVVEAERWTYELAGGSSGPATGFRPNAPQRKAVELRAMETATAYFLAKGALVTDVSSNRSYDLLVELNGVAIAVEVKGTTGEGLEILVTRGEVEHHRNAYPDNALAVVSGIRLAGPPETPEAIGGELRVIEPWPIDDSALAPISYRYEVPPIA